MAIGVQISSFFFAGQPAVDDIFGYFQATSEVQIQNLQITAQVAPTGGNLVVSLINLQGTELGRISLAAATYYNAGQLSTFVTLNRGQAVRAKIVSLDGNATAADLTLNLIGATAQGPNPPSGNCGPSSGNCSTGTSSCTPPSAQLLFFPGNTGPQGPAGPAGPASTIPGPAGATGPFAVYTGDYVSTTTYYDTALRHDIVSYDGSFWVVNNPGKSGTDTWEAPTVTDWTNVGSTFINIATGWKLIGSQEIPVGVNMVSPGFMKSNNFVDATSGWLVTGAGALVAYEAVINGLVSTDTPKFNLDSVTRTMPGTALAATTIPPIASVDIPIYTDYIHGTDDAMIFYGWESGADAFVEHRFGNTNQNFLVSVQGLGTQATPGETGYILPHYRVRNAGGMWGAWTAVSPDVTLLNENALTQSFTNTATLQVALASTQDIQFSASFAQSVYGAFDMTGCTLSAIAFN